MIDCTQTLQWILLLSEKMMYWILYEKKCNSTKMFSWRNSPTGDISEDWKVQIASTFSFMQYQAGHLGVRTELLYPSFLSLFIVPLHLHIAIFIYIPPLHLFNNRISNAIRGILRSTPTQHINTPAPSPTQPTPCKWTSLFFHSISWAKLDFP